MTECWCKTASIISSNHKCGEPQPGEIRNKFVRLSDLSGICNHCSACGSNDEIKNLIIGPDNCSTLIKLCKLCADQVILALGGMVFHGASVNPFDLSKVHTIGKWRTEKQEYYPKDIFNKGKENL